MRGVRAGRPLGDRRPDAAVGCGAYPGGLSVFFNRGDGRLREGGQYLEGDEEHEYEVSAVAIGDLDGDGTSDVAAGYGGPIGSLSVLLNRGDGTLRAPVLYDVGEVLSLAIGDLNGDRHLDLVTGRTNAVSVLLNRGEGALTRPVSYAAGLGGYWGVRDVAIADVDGDGALDLTTQNDKDGTGRKG